MDLSFKDLAQQGVAMRQSRECTDLLIARRLMNCYAKSNRYGTNAWKAGCNPTNRPRMRFAGFISRLEQRNGNEPLVSRGVYESPGICGQSEFASVGWSGRERRATLGAKLC